MAEIVKAGVPSISTVLPDAGFRIAGDLFAGEALAAGDACYINPADGFVYRSNGAAVADAAQVHGYTALPAKAGDATTLYLDVNYRYGANLTPGKRLYLSGTVLGGLADAPSTGGTTPVAFVIDSTRIRVFQSRY